MPLIVFLPILLLAVWLTVATLVVAVCRAASNGDTAIRGAAPSRGGGLRQEDGGMARRRRSLVRGRQATASAGPRI